MLTYETLCGEDLELGIAATTKTDPGGGTLPGTQVSIATLSLLGAAGKATQAAWTPGTVAAGQSVNISVTVQGAILTDYSFASFSLSLGGLTLTSNVDSANTVVVTLSNPSAAAITLALGTVRVLVFRAP